jgi:hypothetical protein
MKPVVETASEQLKNSLVRSVNSLDAWPTHESSRCYYIGYSIAIGEYSFSTVDPEDMKTKEYEMGYADGIGDLEVRSN